jgi:hypothetical protein
VVPTSWGRAARALALALLPPLAFLQGARALGSIAARLGGPRRLFVGEETSLLRGGLAALHPWYVALLGAALYSAGRLALVCLRRGAGVELFAWGALAASYAAGFAEMRHLYVFSSLQLVGFALFAFALADLLAARAAAVPSPRVAGTGAVLRGVALTACALPLLLSVDVLDRAALRQRACAMLPIAEEASTWLRQNTAPVGENGPAPYGVFGPWSLGHHLHVLGGRAVVVDPFNHATPAGDWVGELVQREWLAHSAAELIAPLRELGVRYLVLTNPAEEIAGALRRGGEPGADVYRFEPDGRLTYLPGMSRLAAFRLFMTHGSTPEFDGLVLRYAGRAQETYQVRGADGAVGTARVPSLQIYELVP